MRKFVVLLTILLLLVFTGQAYSAWNFQAVKVSERGHYMKFLLTCISDGAALTATDIMPFLPAQIKSKIIGGTLMSVKIDVGVVATTVNITLTDDEADSLYTISGVTTPPSWRDLSGTMFMYIPVFEKVYLAVNDIGSAGDTIYLYFIVWTGD